MSENPQIKLLKGLMKSGAVCGETCHPWDEYTCVNAAKNGHINC